LERMPPMRTHTIWTVATLLCSLAIASPGAVPANERDLVKQALTEFVLARWEGQYDKCAALAIGALEQFRFLKAWSVCDEATRKHNDAVRDKFAPASSTRTTDAKTIFTKLVSDSAILIIGDEAVVLWDGPGRRPGLHRDPSGWEVLLATLDGPRQLGLTDENIPLVEAMVAAHRDPAGMVRNGQIKSVEEDRALLSQRMTAIPASTRSTTAPSRPATRPATKSARLTLDEATKAVRDLVYRETPGMDPDAQFPVRDLTTDEMWARMAVQAFRITSGVQEAETVAIRHGKAVRLGSAFGGPGVNGICVADLDRDGRDELIYSFAFGSGVTRSHVALRRADEFGHEVRLPWMYWGKVWVLRVAPDGGVRLLDDEARPSRELAQCAYDRASRRVVLKISPDLPADVRADICRDESRN